MAKPFISLKKYLDLDPEELRKLASKSNQTEPNDLLSSTLECYRSALGAMGSCGAAACPALGADLQESLRTLAEPLSSNIREKTLRQTEERIEQQLQQWGGRTAEHFKNKASEVKELLILLARTAEAAAARDQRHAYRFTELTEQLQSIANLDDLTQIRTSLVQKAAELKACVDRMTQDGRESVAQLQTQLSCYETKLQEAEQQASLDSLTGLDNRRAVQKKIESRIEQERTFSVAMLDVNGFKQINDRFGHLAGDELLKQFAAELRSAFRATDVVGRWGGDEFVLVMDCSLAEAAARLERIRKWVFGEYTVQCATGPCRVYMRAATGLAQWQPGYTLPSLLECADAEMYRQKMEMRRPVGLEAIG
jgi:diguanylate cyclase (GGDEF)-like protein